MRRVHHDEQKDGPSETPRPRCLAAIRDMSIDGEAFLRTWDHYVTTILAAGETALTMGGWPAVNTLLAAWGPTVVGAQLRRAAAGARLPPRAAARGAGRRGGGPSGAGESGGALTMMDTTDRTARSAGEPSDGGRSRGVTTTPSAPTRARRPGAIPGNADAAWRRPL